MKQLYLKTLVLLLMSMVGSSAFAFEVDGVYYKTSGEMSVEVTYYPSYANAYSGSITIPSSVEFQGVTYSVTGIGSSAFSGCTNLVNVEIPNSVISIGSYAFQNCTSLTVISIPESVTNIGIDAFYKCTKLTVVDIPNSVTMVGRDAFAMTNWYNNQPDGLIYIGKVAYNYKWELDENWDYPEDIQIVIKEGTTYIAENAFKGCLFITGVTIPESVTSIGKSAFEETRLSSLTIPNSVTTIGEKAFCYSGLSSVTIGESVTKIGDEAFKGNPLVSVKIPNSVTSIGKGAFYGCGGLTSITIPNSVTSIGKEAFYGCSKLASITIAESVTQIGSNAFEGTPWYDNQPDGLVYAGKVAYKYKGLMLYNTKIVLDDGTVGIAEEAFKDCNSMTGITIPNGVVRIGDYAFQNCISLTNVIIPESVKIIGSSAFRECRRIKRHLLLCANATVCK